MYRTFHNVFKITLTKPSVVTAAKTVEEYGPQATSPTDALSSNVNMGALKNRSYNGHTKKMLHRPLIFHIIHKVILPVILVPDLDGPIRAARDEDL